MKIQIEGNLYLRSLEISDADELFQVVDENRTHLREWLPWLDYNKTPKDSENFIKNTLKEIQETGTYSLFIIFDDKIVGIISQHMISQSNKYTTIGYWLAKSAAGNGIMTKALRKMMELSFYDQSLELVILAAAVENQKSRKVAERVGMKFEGILRQREWLYDHFVDHASYSMTKEEFEVCKI